MRSSGRAALFAAAAITGACTNGTPVGPETFTVPLHVSSAPPSGSPFGAASHAADAPHNARTHLTGKEEVPPNASRAQGQAIFQISKDGDTISYKLITANIQNVTQAHIHLGSTGVNGPVVVWLYPSGPPAQLIPGRTQGVLAEGVITAASLVGLLAGQPLSVLIDHIEDQNAYVNVHTSQFPPGEIRGQID